MQKRNSSKAWVGMGLIGLMVGVAWAAEPTVFDLPEMKQCTEGPNADTSQAGLRECMEQTTKAEEKKMNQALAILIHKTKDRKQVAAIRHSQQLWKAYRDSACGLFGTLGEGSGSASVEGGCYAEKTHARLQELQEQGGENL